MDSNSNDEAIAGPSSEVLSPPIKKNKRGKVSIMEHTYSYYLLNFRYYFLLLFSDVSLYNALICSIYFLNYAVLIYLKNKKILF